MKLFVAPFMGEFVVELNHWYKVFEPCCPETVTLASPSHGEILLQDISSNDDIEEIEQQTGPIFNDCETGSVEQPNWSVTVIL